MEMIKARDLKLADVVCVMNDAWGTAIVIKIEADAITLFRPYGITANFSCTGGGVIPYIGTETYRIHVNDLKYKVWHRKELA
jgi:hypothetical protein